MNFQSSWPARVQAKKHLFEEGRKIGSKNQNAFPKIYSKSCEGEINYPQSHPAVGEKNLRHFPAPAALCVAVS